MAKNRYLILFVFLFLILNSGTVLALEISDYPSVPGIDSPGDCAGPTCLAKLIGYFCGLGIYIAGGLVVISFALGAVAYIVSPDSPEMRSNSKDRMKGSILGLILLVSAFVVLKTINPALVEEAPLRQSAGLPGVYYNDNTPAPILEPYVPEDKTGIKYICDNDTGPVLIIWFFLEKDFESYENATVQRINCGGETGINGDSFKMAFQTPGVYYFLEAGCSGYMSEVNGLSMDDIGAPFRKYWDFPNNGWENKKSIKSIRIVNDPAKNIFYGAILHKDAGLAKAGVCQAPIIPDGDEKCEDVNIDCGDINNQHDCASAINIFKINKTPGSSGTGVSFFSAPFGWDTGARAGFYDVLPDKISAYGEKLIKEPEKMCFSYKNINKAYRPDEYRYKCGGGTGKCQNTNNDPDRRGCSYYACETFKDCPASMKLKGDYLVAFYNKNTVNQNGNSGKNTGKLFPPVIPTPPTSPNNLKEGWTAIYATYENRPALYNIGDLLGYSYVNPLTGEIWFFGVGVIDQGRYNYLNKSTGVTFHYDGHRYNFFDGDRWTTTSDLNEVFRSFNARITARVGNESTTVISAICQTFVKNVPNLKVEPFMASGVAELKSIYIIPTTK